MKIDNYSKAIGIIYATSRMMHNSCLGMSVDETAISMYDMALKLVEQGNYPEPKKAPETEQVPTVEYSPEVPEPTEETPKDWGPNGTVRTGGGITTTASAAAEPEPLAEAPKQAAAVEEPPTAAPEAEPVKEAPKTADNSKWRIGEDSFIRCSATVQDAVRNKPVESTKTDTQVQNRWYYMRTRGLLFKKGQNVIYTGGDVELSSKLKGLVGRISTFTDDKEKAVVYFSGDSAAYQIPICDIIRAGEA